MRQPPKRNVVEYLEGDLKQAIQDDVLDVLVAQSERLPGGIHSISREVFCYIDYLGNLRYGLRDTSGNLATTEHAVRFLEEYFSKADPRYKDLGRLIYTMWHHGLVQEYDPKVLTHSTQDYCIRLLANKSPEPHNTACHLQCYKFEDADDEYVIVINLFQLVNHLISALEEFIGELQLPSNGSLVEEVHGHFDEVSRHLSVDELNTKPANKQIINDQIEKAVKGQTLIIGRDGQVRRPC